ncbi:MAG: DUF4906 domain-containing protein, partial [Bacteroidales bacterium]|nr:DUF4906 domain-containing protein [Bacteroidales bacterium]
MKNRIYNIFIFAFAAISLLSSCARELDVPQTPSVDENLLVICPRVTAFKDQFVATKGNKSGEEQKINTSTVYIFDANGMCVFKEVMRQDEIKVIDRQTIISDYPAAVLTNCKIYTVANVADASLPSIIAGQAGAEATLTSHIFNFASGPIYTEVPETGLPMMGSRSGINLTTGTGATTGAVDIELICLYAKIVIKLGVNTTQTAPQTPHFDFGSYQLIDIAKKVPATEPAGEDATPTAVANPATATDFVNSDVITWGDPSLSGAQQVSGTTNTLNMVFYIPEYRYNSEVAYSSALPAEFLNGGSVKGEFLKYCQNYKPKFVGTGHHATYVELKGAFSDHQGHSQNVTYHLYLGHDNWHDFKVRRNYEYTNTVTITGITNSKDASSGSISVDHRVSVESPMPYRVSMERESMLDSHIEIRPIRIAFDPDVYSSAIVNITPNVGSGWAKLERRRIGDGTNGAKGTTYNARGKRLFFWEDLLTNSTYGLSESVTGVGTSSGTGYSTA